MQTHKQIAFANTYSTLTLASSPRCFICLITSMLQGLLLLPTFIQPSNFSTDITGPQM